MMLGDLGAEIFKIEEPTRGDDTRSWGPPFAAGGESAYFLSVNRNKKSLAINLKHPRGQELVRTLATQHCDVLVENYLPGKLESMGLGYAQLAKLNPRLIYASITGYGPTGPFAHKPGYDVITEAEAGLMHITGEKDREPVKVGVAITDLTTGLYAHGAILAALLAREKTNLGQKLDISLLACQVASLVNVGSSYLIGGKEATRQGTAHAAIVPYQSFRTANSYIVFGAGNDRQFQKLCQALERPDLAEHSKFRTNADRVQHRQELVDILGSILKTQTTEVWLERLKDTGMPYGPINNIQQTFQHPQVQHQELVQEVEHPTAGPIKMVGPPVRYSRNPPSIRQPPPTHGQHTEDVLRKLLGLDSEEVQQLREEKVIR